MCQQRMDDSYLDFALSDAERFSKLQIVFAALKDAKSADTIDPDDDSWLGLFDDSAREYFWWPTPEEVADWQRRWESTPVPQRFTDPSLVTPWDFSSMIEAFKNGEYELVALDRTTDTTGRLTFNPLAWPFGGTNCMRALIESFGGVVTHEAGT